MENIKGVMTKQEVIEDAIRYANMIRSTVYVYRRGDAYKASMRRIRGWKVAEIIEPQSVVAEVADLLA